MEIFKNFIHDFQILEATKMPFSGCMSIYIDCGAPRQRSDFSTKDSELSIHKKAWQKL